MPPRISVPVEYDGVYPLFLTCSAGPTINFPAVGFLNGKSIAYIEHIGAATLVSGTLPTGATVVNNNATRDSFLTLKSALTNDNTLESIPLECIERSLNSGLLYPAGNKPVDWSSSSVKLTTAGSFVAGEAYFFLVYYKN